MLLMVARETVLALRASGEEGLGDEAAWTGVSSLTLFHALRWCDFSSFWS